MNQYDAFLKYCEGFLGTLYQWGGDFDKWLAGKHWGLDCSGFEQALARWQGIDEKGDQTADGIMNWYLDKGGRHILKGQEQVGDRVFYGSNGHATHIACIVGPNKIIGAQGGGKNCTQPGIARGLDAKIRYEKMDYRKILTIVRPANMKWENQSEKSK